MTSQPIVLAVDDEPAGLRLIKFALGSDGFQVVTAENGEAAIAEAERRRPDLALIDLVMPGMDGLEVMRRLRERSPLPVILLTAKDHDQDKVKGLEMGADDYVVKPFDPGELGARVRAVLRRCASPRGLSMVRAGDLEVDLNNREVRKGGVVVQLTRMEWKVLSALAVNADRIVPTVDLLTEVWGPEYVSDLQYLRVWISRLRMKLGDDRASPSVIRTFQGLGYVLETQAELAPGAR